MFSIGWQSDYSVFSHLQICWVPPATILLALQPLLFTTVYSVYSQLTLISGGRSAIRNLPFIWVAAGSLLSASSLAASLPMQIACVQIVSKAVIVTAQDTDAMVLCLVGSKTVIVRAQDTDAMVLVLLALRQ